MSCFDTFLTLLHTLYALQLRKFGGRMHYSMLFITRIVHFFQYACPGVELLIG